MAWWCDGVLNIKNKTKQKQKQNKNKNKTKQNECDIGCGAYNIEMFISML